MKKWKNIPCSEKWMLIAIVILLIGILIRWAPVKDGVSRGFDRFHSDDAPADSSELKITLPADTFPVEQTVLIAPEPENE